MSFLTLVLFQTSCTYIVGEAEDGPQLGVESDIIAVADSTDFSEDAYLVNACIKRPYSCHQLLIEIINPSTFYDFSLKAEAKHGFFYKTKPTSSLKHGKKTKMVLTTSFYGPKLEASLINKRDDIKLSLDVQQNYCFLEAGAITVHTTSNNPNVKLKCHSSEGSAGSQMNGCVTCTIETPRYQAYSIGSKYKGESTGCPWQNKEIGNQRCFPPVMYYNRSQREELRLHVGPSSHLLNSDGDPFDTREAGYGHSRSRVAIYVMSFDGTIYASNTHPAGLFHHSTFYAGGQVAAAGEMEVFDGKIQYLSNCSGHYRPGASSLKNVQHSLLHQGYNEVINTTTQCGP